MIGLALLSFSSFMLCELNLNIATMNIVIPNFIMGIGMSMCMIPIITLSTMTLTNEQMTNASGVQNLLKNIGGAIGTSIVTTLISRKAQAHQSYLVDNLTMLNDNFIERLHYYQSAFVSMSNDIHANYMAQTMLYKQMLQQANMGAFRDTFATRALENDMKPKTLQDILGHADFGTTMNIYAHVMETTKEAEMQQVKLGI